MLVLEIGAADIENYLWHYTMRYCKAIGKPFTF